jgi:Protein of unknown function (DUF3011)
MFLRAAVSVCVIALLGISPPARAHHDETVECRSKGYDYTECVASFRHPQLVQQLSDSECVENRSWGVKSNRVIWVSAGCAAVFAESEERYSNRDREDNRSREDDRDRRDNYSDSQDPRYDRRDDRRQRERPSEVVECRSHGYAFTRCDANWNSARLIEQLSDSGCVEGESWGVDDDGLWVDKGCAGRFAGE